MTVVETPLYLRKTAAPFDEEERAELAAYVAANPAAGDVIPEAGGVRKPRWAAKGKGKRGGARIIYYYHDESTPVFLLSAYAKSEQVNLSKAERNEMRRLAPQLIRDYRRRSIP